MSADLNAGLDRRVVLVRHGQTAWNAEGRAQGHADVSLDDAGRAQAEAMATELAELRPSLLVSSDLARARETAAFLEKETGLTAVVDARWREYDVGERTGLTRAEFAERMGAEHQGSWDVHAHVQVAGAETPEDVALRAGPAFRDVLGRLKEGETALVVTHGASLRIALAVALGWPVDTATGIEAMHNCGWAVLAETGPGRLRLSSYNQRAGHLPPD